MVSCSSLYLYYRTTCFMSGACRMCLTIFYTTHSLSLTASSLSFSLRGVCKLCCFALLCGCPSCRGKKGGAFAPRLMDTVCRLPLFSIVTVLCWTLIIWYGPLVRAYSFLCVFFAKAIAEASSTVRKD